MIALIHKYENKPPSFGMCNLNNQAFPFKNILIRTYFLHLCQSAFHGLRPKDLRSALRLFLACGVQMNEKTFGVRNLFGSWRAKLHAAEALIIIFLHVTDVKVHDLQLFDPTFMEISGGPVPLHPPHFSGIQKYKFNKLTIFSAYHTNSLAHLWRALYMECTLAPVSDAKWVYHPE